MKQYRIFTTTAVAMVLTIATAASSSAAETTEDEATAPPKPAPGQCADPVDETAAPVAYRWRSRTQLWRARPVAGGIVARRAPGPKAARVGELATLTEHAKQSAWYLVLDASQVGDSCWLKLRLPAMPNDKFGWVLRDELATQRTYWQIEVDLSDRRVRAYQRGKLRTNARVVIGSSATPTPKSGTSQPFAIYDVVKGNPNAFTGSWQLATTSINPFNPSIGRVGLHGRGGASLATPLGQAASNGCIRMANADVNKLVQLVRTGNLFAAPVVIVQ